MVTDYERRHSKIILSPPTPRSNTATGSNSASTSSAQPPSTLPALSWLTTHPHYSETLAKKAYLVMGVLARRLGKDAFLKVIQRILATAQQHTQHTMHPGEWARLLTLGWDSLLKVVSAVTGKDLDAALDQWVHHGGHAHLHLQYHFNRRRNLVEVEVRQEQQPSAGRQLYVGPLTLVIQELDGVFTHTIQVDAALSKHDLPCHFKGRKQKKKKIPMSTGEEEEVDLSSIDNDSPILWMR